MISMEKINPVWGSEPKNWTGAASASDIVSLKNYNRARITIQTGAWAAGTAAVTLKQATTVADGSVKALAFDTMWTNKAAVGTFVKTAVVSNTFNLDTANSIWVIEVKAEDLDVQNGFDCLHCDIASPGANNDFYGVLIEMLEPRFQQETLPDPTID